MNIRFANVLALALLLAALVMGIKMRHEIGAFLATMRHIGPGHNPEQQVIGLVAAGIILVTLVAIVRILSDGRRG